MLPNYEYLTVTRSLTCDQVLLMLPDTVDVRWVGDGRWAMGFRQHKSRLCPESIRVQSLSNFNFFTFKSSKCEPWVLFPKSKVCQEIVQRGKMPYFQFVWTDFWQSLDLPVQTVSKCLLTWPSFDIALTRLGQCPDRPSTWGFFGRTLDRDWTRLGQRLDLLSNPCPTNHRQVVPNF